MTPVTILTGFLGSGKTTLLNHLLGQPDMADTAVLINEFGDVSLDHLFVREIDEGITLLSSGCICCTVQGELVDSLRELYLERLQGEVPEFTRLLIETTGLADPAPIIAALVRDPMFKSWYALQGIVTTIDVVLGQETLDAQDEAVKQAAVADRLVLTKCDLASDEQKQSLKDRLREMNPGARQVTAEHGAVAADFVLAAGPFDAEAKGDEVQAWLNAEAYHPHDHDHGHGHD